MSQDHKSESPAEKINSHQCSANHDTEGHNHSNNFIPETSLQDALLKLLTACALCTLVIFGCLWAFQITAPEAGEEHFSTPSKAHE